jgi:hypothetical protein
VKVNAESPNNSCNTTTSPNIFGSRFFVNQKKEGRFLHSFIGVVQAKEHHVAKGEEGVKHISEDETAPTPTSLKRTEGRKKSGGTKDPTADDKELEGVCTLLNARQPQESE